LASIVAGVSACLAALFIAHPPSWWFDPGVVGLVAAAIAFAVTIPLTASRSKVAV
jgi:hypothetical protein